MKKLLRQTDSTFEDEVLQLQDTDPNELLSEESEVEEKDQNVPSLSDSEE